MKVKFQSTYPVRGTSAGAENRTALPVVSILVPREGYVCAYHIFRNSDFTFQSTYPVRGTSAICVACGDN